jgi:hypothetical protein
MEIFLIYEMRKKGGNKKESCLHKGEVPVQVRSHEGGAFKSALVLYVLNRFVVELG